MAFGTPALRRAWAPEFCRDPMVQFPGKAVQIAALPRKCIIIWSETNECHLVASKKVKIGVSGGALCVHDMWCAHHVVHWTGHTRWSWLLARPISSLLIPFSAG
jgi:hypothetical protein